MPDFENILSCAPDSELGGLLQVIDRNILARALKAASPAAAEKLFRSMETAEAEILRAEIAALGPIPLEEAETAQRKIAAALAPAKKQAQGPYPGIKSAILLSLLLLGVQFGLGLAAGICSAVFKFTLNSAFGGVLMTAINLASAAAVLAAGVKKTGKPFAGALRLKPVPPAMWAAALLFMAGMVIVLSEIDNLVNMLLPMPETFRAMFDPAVNGYPFPVSLFMIGILPAFYEEMIFRGLFLSGFSQKYSTGKTVFVTALLFGLVHLNPWQFVTAFLIGLVFAWISLESGSILPCIFMHFFNNTVSVLAGAFQRFVPVPGFNSGLDAPGHIQPLWFDITGIVLGSAGFTLLRLILRRKNAAGNRVEIPE